VGADVEDFEYTPKQEYQLPEFRVFNEIDEKAVMQRFVSEIVRCVMKSHCC
jgi:DNA polymerase epsilon subunit 1